MEILGMNVLLPAMVTYKTTSGTYQAFCYIDQMTGEVNVVDEVANQQELQTLIAAYFKGQKRRRVVPPIPEEGFNKLDPKNYTNPE